MRVWQPTVKCIFDNCAQSQNKKHDTVCHLAHHRQNQATDSYSWGTLKDKAHSNKPCKEESLQESTQNVAFLISPAKL
jgi:hypothetical protein